MVGVARRLDHGKISQPDQIKSAYKRLIEDKSYISAVSGATADKPLVEKRMELATAAFASVK
jgi:hypothetical protein